MCIRDSYGTMAAPHFTNIANIPAVAAILVAGITSIFVNKVAANHKKDVYKRQGNLETR